MESDVARPGRRLFECACRSRRNDHLACRGVCKVPDASLQNTSKFAFTRRLFARLAAALEHWKLFSSQSRFSRRSFNKPSHVPRANSCSQFSSVWAASGRSGFLFPRQLLPRFSFTLELPGCREYKRGICENSARAVRSIFRVALTFCQARQSVPFVYPNGARTSAQG